MTMARRWLITVALLATVLAPTPADEAPAPPQLRRRADQLREEGNWQEAYEAYRRLLIELKPGPQTPASTRRQDLRHAVECLQRLNRLDRFDAFLEQVIDARGEDWQTLRQAAAEYYGISHYGYIVAGEFERGHHRGGGRWVNAFPRDRVRALQLMDRARQRIPEGAEAAEVQQFYFDLARYLLQDHRQAWRLQTLTDLTELPDYDEGNYYHRGGTRGAPVDETGAPVFYAVPASWQAARNDGERWRWCLMQAAEHGAPHEAALARASFAHQQFGVQTMDYYGRWFGRFGEAEDEQENESGIFAVHTLAEDETIARTAAGVKRFALPPDYNFIRIYAEYDRHRTLAGIFENRRQYPKAITHWQAEANAHAEGSHRRRQAKERIRQIVGNWGRFEPVMTQPAGRGATVDFRFRNATEVSFTAHRIRLKTLLEDIQAYVKSKPDHLDHRRLRVEQIGWRIVRENETKYVGEQVAAWRRTLQPRPNHWDKRVTVQTPLEQAGVYLLKAQLPDGNVGRIILWVNDTAIVRKPLDGKMLYYVCDAAAGTPVEKATLTFFGYRQNWHQDGKNYRIFHQSFAEYTDADGLAVFDGTLLNDNLNWLTIATTPEGRLACFGFSNVWFPNWHDREYHRTRSLVVTDRPVYRPGHTVKWKAWLRHAQYDMPDESRYAGKSVTVSIRNPRGDEVWRESLTADAYGGVSAELPLPDEAPLGTWRVSLHGISGGNTFRVEEYKKPEYEVTVEAPETPIRLGEEVQATVKAAYYFGAPVTEATVSYKVLRHTHDEVWFPPMPWDWFYGSGYWWFAPTYTWYPGWREWGFRLPPPYWMPRRQAPPEVVAQGEAPIGPDGTYTVPIDTAAAAAIHPDQDHRYEITAEVRDQSRRTVVGTGKVLVARRAFDVRLWVDRGWYRVGETVRARVRAHTLDRRPVAGEGSLTLYRITYDAQAQPVETEVQRWALATNDRGEALQQLSASRPGQYRLAAELTDEAGHTITGGYIFVVRGEGFDGREFRFNQLELVLDQAEYAPGDQVRALINADRAGTTVLLFERPSSGVYLPPRVLHLEGKSTVATLTISRKDMPNVFLEALTVTDGTVHTQAEEIVVPPQKRILNVEVLPGQTEHRPGQTAEVAIRLTDLQGRPFAGSTVVTVYDKSVEYISGGSNVEDIKSYFWKWRRHHHPRSDHNLNRYGNNLLKEKEAAMMNLGVFGHRVPRSELKKSERDLGGFDGRPGAARRREGAGADMALAEAPETEAAADSFGPAEPKAAGAAGGGGETAEPTVRKQFADTAFWRAALETDEKGMATIEVPMPDQLTTWRVKVWAMGHGTRVGEGAAELITTKDLILRMQAPRFFVEGDEVVLSANIHNYLETAKDVKAVLELDGDTLQPLGETTRIVEVAADGEARVDWRVKALREGTATVRMKALTDQESDAMQNEYPVFVHGMDKMVPFSGVVRPAKPSAAIAFTVPEARRVNETRLELRYSPTLAMAMVDALPYLVEYPYGCTEQTLNRFLPTVVTQNVLKDLGVDLADVREKRVNLNAQELGEAGERAEQWKKRNLRRNAKGKLVPRNPVWDEAEVARMVKKGVKDLTNMQLTDGGWGWFSGSGAYSYSHTTAVVVHGLLLARENGVAVVPGTIERGVEWLKTRQAQEVRKLQNWHENADKRVTPYKRHADNRDALVYGVLSEAEVENEAMREFLYRDRNRLSVYSKCLLGLAYHRQGHTEKRAMLIRNIEQFLQQDDENQTAWLELRNGGYWWYWYGSEIEAMAAYLKLKAATDPQGPIAPRLVKYLLNNRKHATYWNSTRDTAYVIEAFADYLAATGEAQPDQTIAIYLDGEKQQEVTVTAENLFTFDNNFVLLGDAVAAGEHRLELRREGEGPLYFNAYLSYFTLEDFIEKAGLEIKVERDVYRLQEVEKTVDVAGSRGQAVAQRVEEYERVPLASGDRLASGDLLEIELVVESKNDYEYLVFEDMKAAGCEPVRVRSGYTGNALGAYVEFRDERVSFFVRRLARGRHSVSYRLRAEIPGRFSALPARGWAMYAPELRANSDEFKLRIED